MIRLLLFAFQVTTAALAAYNFVTAMWGLPGPEQLPAGPHRRPIRAVIPAHNEQEVLGGLLDDMERQDYQAEFLRTVVLADRCTDGTVDLATGRAEVVERHHGPDGKGPLLSWYLSQDPLTADEALLVLDADNRIEETFVSGMADAFDAGYDAAQAYVDTSNPDESWLATAGALSYWASNRMVQLARHRLGWNPDLGGTGSGFGPEAVSVLLTAQESLTEDQEQSARLAAAGLRVAWLHENRVRDQKPARLGVALQQRARWMSGRRQTRRQNRRRLVGAAWKQRSWGPIDLLIRQTQPGRTFMVLVAVGLAIGALSTDLLWPWWVWLGVAAIQVVLPMAFLLRERVPARYLVRYPLLVVFGLLWVPVRLTSARVRGWYHTPHS
jgi:cellulose synthase/poly-beta-1,6-N-acetylglucosamine synthase-like glycosyltransferase